MTIKIILKYFVSTIHLIDGALSFHREALSELCHLLLLLNLELQYPVDTGRKLNVHKRFRKRPGRLLNVLCTFNLRPVSIDKILVDKIVFSTL